MNEQPTPKPRKLVRFDPYQRTTVLRAHQQFMQVLGTVSSCMNLAAAELNMPDIDGFLVDDVE